MDGTIGDTTVQSGGTLDGTGTTGALTVASGGTLASGDAPGTITTGNLNLETGSALSIEIEGTTPGVGGFDQVDVNGSVTLGGMLSVTPLNGFTPAAGTTFEIIDNEGTNAVTGIFAGMAEGATFTQDGITYSISYKGGDGNDVVLTVGNSPPPPDQPPVVTLGATLPSYTENAPATAIAPSASVTDADSPNFDGGSLTASSSGLSEDQLSILTDATVTVSGGVVSVGGKEIGSVNATNNGGNGASLEIDFDSANATSAAVTTLLQHIAYADSSDDPLAAPRTVTFSVNDGGSTANGGQPIGTGNASFNVIAVNDAPTVSAPSSYTPAPAITISGITFGDVDAEGGTELAIFTASSGTFAVNAAGQALGASGNGTGSVTLVNTIANLNAFIANGDLVLNGATAGGTVTISIDDEGHTGQGPAGGIIVTATANVESGPALTAGAPVTGTEGSSTGTVKLATFTDAAITNPMVGNFMATIDWGDGTAPSTGTVAAEGGGVFDVNGSHTYTEENSYTIHVSVNDGSATASTTDSATIADAPLTASGKSITGTDGQAINNAAVATFTDANPDGALGDFTATIDWGDGSAPSTGMVVAVNGGGFAVDGSHTYQSQGSFTTSVTIKDDGGKQAQVNGSASIAPFLPPNNPPPPAGTTADLINFRSSTGDYAIYDFGHNSVLADHLLTNIAAPWQTVGLGNFSGSGTSDMLLRNTTTGSFEIVDVNNNNASAPILLGNVGLEWQVAGFGDFSGHPGETDMLMRDSNNGAFELYDFSNNAVPFAGPLSGINPNATVLGFGDFSGRPNETDMLTRDSTNTVVLYDISNNAVTSTTTLGNLGSEWQFAAAGDFSSRPGETDLLMRDSQNGNFELYDFQNGKVTAAIALGNVGLEWQVAGVADFSGNPNETDLLMRDSQNGNFELYDFSNNAVTSATALGNVGLEWQVVGTAPYQAAGGATVASDQVQSPFAPVADTDPVEAGRWLTGTTPQGDTSGWLTQAMQANGAAAMGAGGNAGLMAGTSLASGPGFGASSDLTAATAVTCVGISNPLQTHAG